MRFEVCIDSCIGARAAQAASADRVELCANLAERGTTPSLGMLRRVRGAVTIGVQVIIRPRGGDFLYDDDEFEVMLSDIESAKHAGADGVVLGALHADGTVDTEHTARLIAAAYPLTVTFHRAFDLTPDPSCALDALLQLGVQRVLTSGQHRTAIEGLEVIAHLQRQAEGRIIVMPGGGITPENAARLVRETGVSELHFSARERVKSEMRFQRPDLDLGGAARSSAYERMTTSAERIRDTIAAALQA